ncbi:hypothetical protein PUN28_008906 [Cardiocondyla obscurior]|uniref:Uncharacterized protein n=2 Tax=Cardiocondyla obscurior TaxID=286306 RepID=A0AAW2FUK5_9HYME
MFPSYTKIAQLLFLYCIIEAGSMAVTFVVESHGKSDDEPVTTVTDTEDSKVDPLIYEHAMLTAKNILECRLEQTSCFNQSHEKIEGINITIRARDGSQIQISHRIKNFASKSQQYSFLKRLKAYIERKRDEGSLDASQEKLPINRTTSDKVSSPSATNPPSVLTDNYQTEKNRSSLKKHNADGKVGNKT